MKVRVLSRNPSDFQRETKRDIHKLPRNYDPALHPLAKPREYTQALNATKLERVFAKPLIGALHGHVEEVTLMAKHPKKLSILASGAGDGGICIWDLATRRYTHKMMGHGVSVNGLVYNCSGERLISCGNDKAIKIWDPSQSDYSTPVTTILSQNILNGMSHHQKDNVFATCGSCVDIWRHNRTHPTKTYEKGHVTMHNIAFNPIETHLLCATDSERYLSLYDIRAASHIRRMHLRFTANAVKWNPMEAFNFTIASDDYSLYTFDMRRFTSASRIHNDHVAPVIDLDYSPTGKEFVSGSYDKTIRIFGAYDTKSREVYHTKRMQRIKSICWSLDNRYILSGSDEMNIRIWKANASEKLGIMKPRERRAMEYNAKLKETYKHHPKIQRISKHRHVPRAIIATAREHSAIKFAQKKRQRRERAHSKKSDQPEESAKSKPILKDVK